MAKKEKKGLHKNTVKKVVSILSDGKFCDIKADITGYRKPAEILSQGGKYIPDVTATRDTETVLIQVETSDSINDKHTEKQLIAFEEHAKKHAIKFYLVVPKGMSHKIKERVRQLGVQTKVLIV